MRNCVFFIAAVVFLSSCNNSLIVQFRDETPEGMQWLEEAATQYGVSLNIWGIHALDKDMVFLFGGLNTGPGTLRSVLLRSTDGGQHWREVMQPETASDITELVFVEDGRGWALALWTVEGPGSAHLYHTADYGESWRKMADIPLGGYSAHSYPVGLDFTDSQHGSIKIFDISSEHCYLYKTTDGGMTWSVTDKLFTDNACAISKNIEFVARDKSEWRVVSQSDTKEIRRRLSPGDTWIVPSRLQTQLKYSNGKIAMP